MIQINLQVVNYHSTTTNLSELNAFNTVKIYSTMYKRHTYSLQYIITGKIQVVQLN